jgi:ribosomal protein S27AE
MADAKKKDLQPHCPGCGSQDPKKGSKLADSVFLNNHPDQEVEVEECAECGTTTYKLTTYFMVIR